MNSSKQLLGFDRNITLNWLDATLELAANGLPSSEIYHRLDAMLEGQVAGTTPNSARGKTKTVLMHIWVKVPAQIMKLRDRAIELSQTLDTDKRIVLHWGMCIATYPLFLDIALTTGRLMQMQGEVSGNQIQRRIAEIWGERSTLTIAVQRVLRSLVDWNILLDSDQAKHYKSTPKLILKNQPQLELWLIEAFMAGSNLEMRSFKDLIATPALFPFQISLSSNDFDNQLRLEFVRQGLGDELVVMR